MMQALRFLLVGSGAREHALAWKFSRSPLLKELFLWPRSFITEALPNTKSLIAKDWREALDAARAQGIDAVVVGPETPLAEGIRDYGQKIGLPVFGPEQSVARLESSKSFAKDVMKAANIPTAAYEVAESRAACTEIAARILETTGAVVIKADGLAAGKGVFVCHNAAEVASALSILYESVMKNAAKRVVVEEKLIGRECSFFSFLGDGAPESLGFAVDYKRLNDGHQGPNTGGMGCYTPVPWLPQDADEIVMSRVVRPLLAELRTRGLSYVGCLYVGIMWHPQKGPFVVEFNVRLGDPEAQVLAVRDERDWVGLIASKLGLGASSPVALGGQRVAVGVVLAARGYPYEEAAPAVIALAQDPLTGGSERHAVFASSLERQGAGRYRVGSGRVMTVVGMGKDWEEARNEAYRTVGVIHDAWPDAHYRQDIAHDAKEESP